MVNEGENSGKTPFNGTAVTGAALGGSALLVSLLNGGLGNILGGARPPVGDPPWARDMNYERELTEKDSKIGKLEAQLYTDQQITELRKELQAATATQAVINAQQTGVIGLLQSQVNTLNAMTSLYIKQPVMAASEAALSAFTAAKTATAAASNG